MRGYKKCPNWLKLAYRKAVKYICEQCKRNEEEVGKLTPHRIRSASKGGTYTPHNVKKESEDIISDIHNAPDWNFKGKEYDKRIASVRRKTLYLYQKITKDKKRKFKDITSIFEKIEKKLLQSQNKSIKEICECGHHTSDHSYNVDCSTNLECDICDCKEFEVQDE